MKKIAFIGGGSAKFVGGVTRDILMYEELADSHISLMDIDAGRMARSERLICKMISDRGYAATVSSTTNQRKALEGADYVLITVMVGVMQRDRRLIRQAVQADPLTGAILTLPKITLMVDDLSKANADYMKGWPK